MDITLDYAIAAGGILTVFFLANLARLAWPLFQRVSREASKHLSYTYLVRRHRYLGPWTPADVLVQAAYVDACCYPSMVAIASSISELEKQTSAPPLSGPYGVPL